VIDGYYSLCVSSPQRAAPHKKKLDCKMMALEKHIWGRCQPVPYSPSHAGSATRSRHRLPYVGYFVAFQRKRKGGWGEEASTNYRGPAVRKGVRWPTMVHVFSYFSVVSYMSIVQINPFRPTQVTLQLSVSLSDFVQRFLVGPPLPGKGGGGRKNSITGARTRCRRPCGLAH
jgi:hypothetical protein